MTRKFSTWAFSWRTNSWLHLLAGRALEDLAENLLAEAKQYINIHPDRAEDFQARRAPEGLRPLRDVPGHRSAVRKGPPEDMRCWQEDELNLCPRVLLSPSAKRSRWRPSGPELFMGGTSQPDEQAQKKRRLDFSSAMWPSRQLQR
jgi:hypothetical protein